MTVSQRKADAMTMPGKQDGGTGFSPWRLLPVAVLFAGLALFFALDLDSYLSFDVLRQHRGDLTAFVAAHFAAAASIYVVAYIAVVSFSLPGGAVMSLAGGFLFGVVLGSILTVIGATVGSIALFCAAKTAFADVLRARAGPAIRRMRDGFQDNAFSYLLFLRLIPVFPFWLVNLVPALLNVSLPVYVAATFLGIIPGTIVYVSVGNGLGAIFDAGETPDLGMVFEPEILLPLIGLAILSLLPVLYKKWRGRSGGG
jgi:uncharacterized membrane protein YdjX (TVP38/TMEM64 family)